MANQVKDDLALLKMMNDDMKSASSMYNPTNYWAYYEKVLMPELENQGLADFRRRKHTVLRSFGATDIIEKPLADFRKSRLFYNRILRQIPGWDGAIRGLNNFGSGIISMFPGWKQARRQQPYDFCKQLGEKFKAKPLDGFSYSDVGNPEDRIEVDGRLYTFKALYYYQRYVYAQRFFNFEKIQTLVELGSGSGKSIEVLKKLYPNITYILFDISPQLYVCEQWLKEVFPNDVVSYRDCRNMTSLDNLQSGKIYVFGAWHFPLLKGQKVDLFWNCASFQEMEPDVVANYLSFVNDSAKEVFLLEKMNGKEIAGQEGSKGVLNPVTMADYKKGLSNFTMKDLQVALHPDGNPMWDGYEESIWVRK
ncbi:MAG: putative sugar O-methyltransferase [Flavobacteriales bacterium]